MVETEGQGPVHPKAEIAHGPVDFIHFSFIFIHCWIAGKCLWLLHKSQRSQVKVIYIQSPWPFSAEKCYFCCLHVWSFSSIKISWALMFVTSKEDFSHQWIYLCRKYSVGNSPTVFLGQGCSSVPERWLWRTAEAQSPTREADSSRLRRPAPFTLLLR